MATTPEHILVLTTCPDADSAGRLARTLVEQGLAACVNVLPGVQSTYRWKGGIESAAEVMLLAKTRVDRYPAVERALRALHPYELPEIIAVPISLGLTDYLAWVDAGLGSAA
jgi:periplasmic divalent cation tolerance protein